MPCICVRCKPAQLYMTPTDLTEAKRPLYYLSKYSVMYVLVHCGNRLKPVAVDFLALNAALGLHFDRCMCVVHAYMGLPLATVA
jgi:hypothetical protein